MSGRKIIAWLCFPITMWYAIVVIIRNIAFATGILKQEVPKVTTIGVGNLTTGGSGKTPHIEHLLEMLGREHKSALLSRGYRRKTKGYVLATPEQRDAQHIGDEPSMIKQKFPHVEVAVCEKRVLGVNKLIKKNPQIKLIVMDDVYQHRYIKPTINILLTEYHRPYCSDSILPFGNLREFKSGRDRAGIIVVTKSPKVINPIERYNLTTALKIYPYQKVYFSYYEYGNLVSLHDRSERSLNEIREAVVVTGIAHPEPLLEHVNEIGCKVTHMRYKDHHNYSQGDYKKIAQALKQAGDGAVVITTEKDSVKIKEALGSEELANIPIYYIPIKVCFHNNNEHSFDKTIQDLVRENISFLEKLKTSSLLSYQY